MLYGKTYGYQAQCYGCGEPHPKHAGVCQDCKEPGCDACMSVVEGDELKCSTCSLPECPNCGKHATFREHTGNFTDTHGLDCGPYETWTEVWLTCDKCGAKTDERELQRMAA